MKQSRITRRPKFDLSLEIKGEGFIDTADPAQQNWSIVRTMDELADDLDHLDSLSSRFVDGSQREAMVEEWAQSQAQYDDSQLVIDGQQVMQDWERPYMEAMARIVTETHGNILEVGFGMGISASYIQAMEVNSHTIIECNQEVIKEFETWKENYPGKDIRIVYGKWQDVIDDLDRFDGIFFDTYPMSEAEFNEYVINSVTFGEHFFDAAAKHLKKSGIFTYYSNEIDSVSRRHQRALFKYFSEISFSVCHPLFPPADCNYWWADSMVVTKCIK